MGFSLAAASRVCSPGAVHELLAAGASCCRAQALGHVGFRSCSLQPLRYWFNNCSTQAQLPHAMWSLPRPGTRPVSSAVAGGFFTIEPPGKPKRTVLKISDSVTTINNPHTGQDEKERIIIKILFKKDFWRERWRRHARQTGKGERRKKVGEEEGPHDWRAEENAMEEERGNKPEGQRAWIGGEKKRMRKLEGI